MHNQRHWWVRQLSIERGPNDYRLNCVNCLNRIVAKAKNAGPCVEELDFVF